MSRDRELKELSDQRLFNKLWLVSEFLRAQNGPIAAQIVEEAIHRLNERKVPDATA